MEKKTGWGGTRQGAGRKRFCEKSTPICLRISERAKRWIQEQAEELGVPNGAIIDLLIDSFEDQAKGVQ